MSFKNFIYYCALCGGWAAFVAWIFAQVLFYNDKTALGLWLDKYPVVQSGLTAAVLGLLVASAIGFLDALLNAVGFQRMVRAMVCLGAGLVGGLLGGMMGELMYGWSKPNEYSDGMEILRVAGWALVGVVI